MCCGRAAQSLAGDHDALNKYVLNCISRAAFSALATPSLLISL